MEKWPECTNASIYFHLIHSQSYRFYKGPLHLVSNYVDNLAGSHFENHCPTVCVYTSTFLCLCYIMCDCFNQIVNRVCLSFVSDMCTSKEVRRGNEIGVTVLWSFVRGKRRTQVFWKPHSFKCLTFQEDSNSVKKYQLYKLKMCRFVPHFELFMIN